jgi:hypothetical protein
LRATIRFSPPVCWFDFRKFVCRRIPLLSQLHDTEEERAHLFHVRGLNGRFHLSSVVVVVVVVTVLHVFLLFVMVSMRARRFFVTCEVYFSPCKRVKKVDHARRREKKMCGRNRRAENT